MNDRLPIDKLTDSAIARAFRLVTGANGGLVSNDFVVDFVVVNATQFMREAEAAPPAAMDPLVATAVRNLRQYLGKASFSSNVDKHAAGSCLDVLEGVVKAGPPRRSAKAPPADGFSYTVDFASVLKLADAFDAEAAEEVAEHPGSLAEHSREGLAAGVLTQCAQRLRALGNSEDDGLPHGAMAEYVATLSSIEAPQVLPPLAIDSTPEEVTAHFNAVDEAAAARAADQDTMVDASDDPAAMNAALVELAGLLGCNCERDEMAEAIDKLQRDAEDVDGLRDQLEQVRARGVDALRTLWLVVRFAGGQKGVVINHRDAAMVDWSRCSLAREDQLADMGMRLRAVDNGSGLGDDAVREFGWRKQPQHQAMHQQLLDMLGAIDHQGAAGRIGELVGLELLLNTGGAGRGVTAIAQERRGQIEREGYAPSEDDEYTAGELAQAACAYITWEWSEAEDREGHLAVHWPASWNPAAFKPKDRRSDLVRAGALVAAEIDRLDRKAAGHG